MACQNKECANILRSAINSCLENAPQIFVTDRQTNKQTHTLKCETVYPRLLNNIINLCCIIVLKEVIKRPLHIFVDFKNGKTDKP